MSRINVRCLLLGLVIGLVGTVPSHIYAGLLSPESSTQLVGRPNVFPMILTRLRTPRARSLLEQIEQAAPVARNAAQRYANFEIYWQRANPRQERMGKTLEAELAWRANQQLRRAGSGHRMVLTAAEGFPTAPADLILVDDTGQPLQGFQSKRRLMPRHITDPKYQGMKFLSTREGLDQFYRDLTRKEHQVARRGVELQREWREARIAWDQGVILRDWYGTQLPSDDKLERLAKQSARSQFERRSARPSVARSSLRVASWLAPVAPAYGIYNDWQRLSAGEVEADYLVWKAPIRTVEAYLAIIVITDPEPISKAGAFLLEGALFAAELTTDAIYERSFKRRQAALQQQLASIDIIERYSAARRELLEGHQ